jgi:hypothetical protein
MPSQLGCCPESSDESVPRRIDVIGRALITVGNGLFTMTFDRAPTWGWASLPTMAAAAVAVVALTGFVVAERRMRWPLVDLSLLGNPRFTVIVVADIVVAISVLSSRTRSTAGR